MPDIERYAEFVEHTRYGRGPRFTRLTPKGEVYLGWNTEGLIPNTAVRADVRKQIPATFHVTHYYDLERECRDCGHMFIFFAEEQKHWYEELQFGLDSGCVRCLPCRKKQQGIARSRQRYEDLFNIRNRTTDQSLSMAECCLDLIENRVFTEKQTQRIRMLLNSIQDENVFKARTGIIRQRLLKIEDDL